MVGMEMRQYNLAHISTTYSQTSKLWTNFLLRMYGKANCAPEERVPRWEISLLVDERGFSCIYDNQSLIMLDDPGVDREPVGPIFVEEHVRNASQSGAARFHLRTSHLHHACTNGVNLRHLLFPSSE